MLYKARKQVLNLQKQTGCEVRNSDRIHWLLLGLSPVHRTSAGTVDIRNKLNNIPQGVQYSGTPSNTVVKTQAVKRGSSLLSKWLNAGRSGVPRGAAVPLIRRSYGSCLLGRKTLWCRMSPIFLRAHWLLYIFWFQSLQHCSAESARPSTDVL